ncbi:transposase [Kitasatospora sp. NPDC085879]|uniref:transposase n=1 Tax=Kitasatospora sp. NPDC085879 TaxID=3154769 RepID=UPI003445E578
MARAYHQDAFTIDWDTKSGACPGGQTSAVWRDAKSHQGTPVIRVRFPARHCTPCPAFGECTKNSTGREITLRPRAEHEAIHAARTAEQGEDCRRRYGHHNGEATVSQGVRAFGLRSSRYRGLGKTQLQHLFTAAAMNLTRLDAWTRDISRAGTRTSRFETLRPAA